MQSPTRSRQHEMLGDTARAARVQRGVFITSLQALEAFVLLARYNPTLGLVVEDLRITLPPHAGYPAQAVRDCLRKTPNIETLVLNLPSDSPVTLLNDFVFPRLVALSTNLPHRMLVSFLHAHPSLTLLVLHTCGRSRTCPLRGLELPQLSDLQCPSRCFAGISRGHLITATVNISRLASMSSLAIQTLSSSHLYSLTVDFFSNDYDVLSRVATAAPNLRKLKLNEKHRPQRRSEASRRPWNNLREWHQTLMRFALLEEFMIRTLRSVTTPQRTEHAVVVAWVQGVASRPIRHSNLFHIAIIQKGTTAAEQRLTHWFRKDGGQWERVASEIVGPTRSFTL